MNELEKAQEQSKLIKETIGKILLTSIPVGGQLATVVWDAVKSHSLEKRRKEWEEAIETRLRLVEKTVEEISSNEFFVTALMATTSMVLRTSDKDKKEYLANAVFNSIENIDDESKLIIFLNLIDRYTAWHIKLLHFFHNPLASEVAREAYNRMGMGAPSHLLQSVYPDFRENSEFLDKIVNDLSTEGLLLNGSIHTTMTPVGAAAKRTTALGDEFLKFIMMQEA